MMLISQSLQKLPQGFTYLEVYAPTVIQNLRYFTKENFVGKQIIGYEANKVICTIDAAVQLAKVQSEFEDMGYSLVIYDAYRPQKSVDQFVEWGKDLNDNKNKAEYYPYVDKKDLFTRGYIAEKSGHSRGSTLDLSIIPKGTLITPIQKIPRTLKDGKQYLYLDDSSFDFGSSFDYFGKASHPINNVLPDKYYDNRKILMNLMDKHNFQILDTEWWHYTLRNEPFPYTYFDFDIK